MMSLTSAVVRDNALNDARGAGLMEMPLSPEQEALCERVEKGEPEPRAAALIRKQAHEIDDLWDRLSRAYALVRREFPGEMIREEMEALRAMLEERRRSFPPGAPKQISHQRSALSHGGASYGGG